MSAFICFQVKMSGETTESDSAASVCCQESPLAVLLPTAMRTSAMGTLWSREYLNAGGAFLQGSGAGLDGTGGRSPLTLELNVGGNDSNGASAELARHGRCAIADDGSGAGRTGLVGLGGMRDDGAESRTGTDDEM